MKYIHKVNFKKVAALKAKINRLDLYAGLALITLTNEGTKNDPAYRVDKVVNENEIEFLGLYDYNRLKSEANLIGYNMADYFGIQQTSTGEAATNETLDPAFVLKSTNAVGIISRVTNLKLIRINEVV